MKSIVSIASSLTISALLFATPVQASSVLNQSQHFQSVNDLIGEDNLRPILGEELTFIATDSAIYAELITRWPGFVKDFGFTNADESFTALINRKFDVITQDVIPDSELVFDARVWAQPRRASAAQLAPFFDDHLTVWSIENGTYAGGFLFSWENLLTRGKPSVHDFSVVVSGMKLYAPPMGNLSEVPVPAAVWLFGSGLLIIGNYLRRRQA